MFVQFIEGRVRDAADLRDQLERWREEVTGGDGWLGTTAGVTTDGTAFVAARFASAEAARTNAARPEQSAWWEATEALFDGEVGFEDHEEVSTFRGGGSDDAGFVQVIRGRVTDADAARRMFDEGLPDDGRPDVLGGVAAFRHDGVYTTVVYFTSEGEARAGERDDIDAGDEFAAEMDALHDVPPRFLDLADPWLWSP
jgi:hypothetical protein